MLVTGSHQSKGRAMISRRRLLRALAALGGAAMLLVACKHWPEEQKSTEPRDGGDGGY